MNVGHYQMIRWFNCLVWCRAWGPGQYGVRVHDPYFPPLIAPQFTTSKCKFINKSRFSSAVVTVCWIISSLNKINHGAVDPRVSSLPTRSRRHLCLWVVLCCRQPFGLVQFAGCSWLLLTYSSNYLCNICVKHRFVLPEGITVIGQRDELS